MEASVNPLITFEYKNASLAILWDKIRDKIPAILEFSSRGQKAPEERYVSSNTKPPQSS